jgi:hypothetical protein
VIALAVLYFRYGLSAAVVLVIAAAIVTAAYFMWQRQKTKSRSSELDTAIDKALANIDSIGQAYRDENEANTELAQSLKLLLPKSKVEYLANSAVGDIKVDNDIVEGKLDLVGISEIDRAVGQINRHLKSSKSKLKIVVYGSISREAVTRITGMPEYNKRIKLRYLRRPNKFRAT